MYVLKGDCGSMVSFSVFHPRHGNLFQDMLHHHSPRATGPTGKRLRLSKHWGEMSMSEAIYYSNRELTDNEGLQLQNRRCSEESHPTNTWPQISEDRRARQWSSVEAILSRVLLFDYRSPPCHSSETFNNLSQVTELAMAAGIRI